ncbi:MAG: alkaline phosphatase [Chloroflexia bacterium]|nr:alkaline phosphatase [Chloroflexia bacterium]
MGERRDEGGSVRGGADGGGDGIGRDRARSVILFIGDGMGATQRDAARRLLGRPLVMDGLPVHGRVGTASADPVALVTDSAAAGTALATGVKTLNGSIAIGPGGERLTSMLDLAKAAGKATGLVTTCQVTDATPAAFGAHVPSRTEQDEIARQYIEETGVDVILGGGEDFWYPAGDPGMFPDDPGDEPTEWSRGTRGNLVRRAIERGYTYVSSAEGLRQARGRKVLGLFANQNLFDAAPPGRGARYEPIVSLAEMTTRAIELLAADSDGFFLMVEEAAIDRMAHKNNAALAVGAVLHLDRAVAAGLAYAERHPDTLIIVTADHECGGLEAGALASDRDEGIDDTPDDETRQPQDPADRDFRRTWGLRWTTTGHTAAAVPLSATGPGSERLAGEIDNVDLFPIVVGAMALIPAPRELALAPSGGSERGAPR